MNFTQLKVWLLAQGSAWLLKTLESLPGKIINYFQTLKEKRDELRKQKAEQEAELVKYRETNNNPNATEEEKIESDINFLN